MGMLGVWAATCAHFGECWPGRAKAMLIWVAYDAIGEHDDIRNWQLLGTALSQGTMMTFGSRLQVMPMSWFMPGSVLAYVAPITIEDHAIARALG